MSFSILSVLLSGRVPIGSHRSASIVNASASTITEASAFVISARNITAPSSFVCVNLERIGEEISDQRHCVISPQFDLAISAQSTLGARLTFIMHPRGMVDLY